ncbi:YkgJ family cysteine cluster protein [Geopseudomonas aromaticivorans]
MSHADIPGSCPVTDLTLIPAKQLSWLKLDTEQQALRNARAMHAASPWLRELNGEIASVAQQGGTPRAKYNRLRKLADRIGAAAAPHAACQKGCSACCSIAVVISSYEADLIGKAIGRRPAPLTPEANPQTAQDRYFGSPCPFLKKGACSIYAERPIACRLHVNLADSSFFCSTKIRPEDSCVPSLDLPLFWATFGMQFFEHPSADIRDFFPG